MLSWNKKSRGSWSKVALCVIFWGESAASIKIVVSHILICDWKFLAKSLCLYICCKRRKKKCWFTCWRLVERCTICYFLSPFWIKLRNMHTSHHLVWLGKNNISSLFFKEKRLLIFITRSTRNIYPWSTFVWKNYRRACDYTFKYPRPSWTSATYFFLHLLSTNCCVVDFQHSPQ